MSVKMSNRQNSHRSNTIVPINEATNSHMDRTVDKDGAMFGKEKD